MLGRAPSAMPTLRAQSAMPLKLATMSTIAVSTTQPFPVRLAAKTPLMMPKASPSAPPASPSTVGGAIGAAPGRSVIDSAPLSAR